MVFEVGLVVALTMLTDGVTDNFSSNDVDCLNESIAFVAGVFHDIGHNNHTAFA